MSQFLVSREEREGGEDVSDFLVFPIANFAAFAREFSEWFSASWFLGFLIKHSLLSKVQKMFILW